MSSHQTSPKAPSPKYDPPANSRTTSSSSHSTTSRSPPVSPYPPQIALRTSIYEDLQIPIDYASEPMPPKWTPSDDKKKGEKSSDKKDGNMSFVEKASNKRHSVASYESEEVSEVFEVFDEQPTGRTMKWKRPQRSQGAVASSIRTRRRALCVIFILIAATSAASIGVSGTLTKQSMTAFLMSGMTEDEMVTQDMLKMSPDMAFSTGVSAFSFIVSVIFAVAYTLQPARMEEKIARTTARILTFPRRAVGALVFFVLIIGAWCAVTALTTMTHLTCNELRQLPLDEGMMVLVGLGRQMCLRDCRINDSLLGFAAISVAEWLIAFSIVVDGHARSLSN